MTNEEWKKLCETKAQVLHYRIDIEELEAKLSKVSTANHEISEEMDFLLVKTAKQQARIEELEALAQALIDDVRARHPGEELRCPHMIALDEALKGADDHDT